MHDNGNAKYAESEGVWKLIVFLSSFILFLACWEEGLSKNTRDLNTVTYHTKEEGEFFHASILRLEQSRIF